jgi:hypothetical protein
MLGGDDGKTLFMMVADWHAADSIDDNLDRLINGPHTGKVPAAAAWASQ